MRASGGEEKADTGLEVLDGKKGPGLGLEKLWNGQMTIVKTLACGDNFINNEEKFQSILPQLERIIGEIKPDVFIAGPAFNAGRYGVACARICDYVRKMLGIPSVTGMHCENPAVSMYVRDNYIVATPETAAGMKDALPDLARLALKLARRERIGPARLEKYIPTGHRYNEYHEKTGAVRTVEMLLKKLRGEEYVTEIPLKKFESIPAAPPLESVEDAVIAIITTGGLVPKGNPDNLRQAFSVTYGKYNIEKLDFIPAGDYESIHGGYDTTIVNEDPNRLVPLDELRNLEKEGRVKGIYKEFFTTCGIGTNVKNSTDIGSRMAMELKNAGVRAAIVTST
jgi:glycine reductase